MPQRPGGGSGGEARGEQLPRGWGTSASINSDFPGDPRPLSQGLPARRQAAWAYFPISMRAFLGNMGSLSPHPTTIPANSAQQELCGADVSGWPGCQDTWGQIPSLSHRALGNLCPLWACIFICILGHGNAALAGGPDGRHRATSGWPELSVPEDMQAGANGCDSACRGNTNGIWHCRHPHGGPGAALPS